MIAGDTTLLNGFCFHEVGDSLAVPKWFTACAYGICHGFAITVLEY